MQKNENIKSYTASELQEMRESGCDLSNWQKLDMLSDDELNKMIAEDSDEKHLNIDWDSATVVHPVKKQQLTLRIDTDIIEFFKKQGRGYQTMMNNILRSYMQQIQQKV